jgi:hypothetical protein
MLRLMIGAALLAPPGAGGAETMPKETPAAVSARP